jgi:hypothetical protein|eukprot:COSAG02_NODE_9559_length_2179_cov_1.414423_3_plen_71_part_00
MEIIKINGDKVDAIKCDPATNEGCNDKEIAYIEKMKTKFAGDTDGYAPAPHRPMPVKRVLIRTVWSLGAG